MFGLGGILYELLTLEPPRDGRSSGSAHDELKNRYHHRLRSIDASVPRALARICERALAFAPKWRHASALDLALDLEAFADGRATSTGRMPLAQRAHELWLYRRSSVVAAAVLLAVTIGLGIAWSVYESREADRVAQRHQFERDLESVLTRADEAPSIESIAGPRATDDRIAAVRDYLEGSGNRAYRTFSKAAASDPDDTLAILVAGLAAAKTRRHPEAARLLGIASRLLPHSLFVTRQNMAALRRADAIRDARAVADGLIRSERSLDAETWHEIARIAFGQPDEALATRAIGEAMRRSDPQPSLKILNTAAVLASTRGDTALAQEIYGRIRARDSDYVLGRYNEAHTLDRECRLVEARRVYARIIALDPRHREALASLAWLHAGSGRDSCTKCKAVFDAKPELYDTELAKRYMLECLEAGAYRSSKILGSLVATAKRIDARAVLGDRLRELQRDPGISNSRLGRITRALQSLDR